MMIEIASDPFVGRGSRRVRGYRINTRRREIGRVQSHEALLLYYE